MVGRVCGLAANFEWVRAHLVFLAVRQRRARAEPKQHRRPRPWRFGVPRSLVSWVVRVRLCSQSHLRPCSCAWIRLSSLTAPPQERPALVPSFSPIRASLPLSSRQVAALFGLAELPVHSRASTSAHRSPPPLLLAEPRASHLDSTCTTGRSTRPRPLISALTIRRLDTYCTSVHTVCPALQFNRLTRPSATATLLPAPAPRHGTHTAAPRTPDPVVFRGPQLQLASSAR